MKRIVALSISEMEDLMMWSAAVSNLAARCHQIWHIYTVFVFLDSWRTDPTVGGCTDCFHVTSFSQFHAGNCCILGFGASFGAINPNCNSACLCFRYTDVGCRHGSESERNNSHIPVPLLSRQSGQRPGLSFPASEPADISSALSAGATKGWGEVQWMLGEELLLRGGS